MPHSTSGPHLHRRATVVMATASRATAMPRVWSADLAGATYQHREVLDEPGILLEGTHGEVFSLLYGFHLDLVKALAPALSLELNDLLEAIGRMKVLRPSDKLSLATMPLQDAIDLAVFLASVQIAMDRFLPGQPACGGPIDVMVLRVTPEPEILAYPGKTLHHPHFPR